MNKQLTHFVSDTYDDNVVEWKICPYTGETFPVFQSYIDLLDKLSPVIGGEKRSYNISSISPEVRERMRLMFRNERVYTNNISEVSGKKMVSLYHPGQAPVVTIEERRKDENDPTSYGIEYSSTDYFFILKRLNDRIPRQNLMTVANTNSDYTSGTAYCNNSYLICASEYADNCYYGKLLQKVEYGIDCLNVFQSERMYQCINCKGCSKSVFLKNSNDCYNCWFSDQLTGCSNCLLCTGLVNKQYHYKNKPLSKEAFEEKLNQLKGNYVAFEAYKKAYIQLMSIGYVKYADITNSEGVIGDVLFDSKDCRRCYNCNECEGCRYLSVGEACTHVLDSNNTYVDVEKVCHTLGVLTAYDVHSSVYIFRSKHMYFCQDCYDCSHCFGCFGLRNRSYCIFNIQYEENEYQEKLSDLIQQMQQDGTWGVSMPIEFSQFPYNDTVAMEVYPPHTLIDVNGNEQLINKNGTGVVTMLGSESIDNAILDLGGEKKLKIKRRFQESDVNIPDQALTLSGESLPHTIDQVDENIIGTVILCEQTKRPYRILKQELSFYKKMGIPLPRVHHEVRYQKRLALLQPRNLYLRSCDKTGEPMISTYHQKDTRKVLSHRAYNQEMYG